MALFTDYLRQKYGLYGLLKSLNYPLSFGVRFAKVYQPWYIYLEKSHEAHSNQSNSIGLLHCATPNYYPNRHLACLYTSFPTPITLTLRLKCVAVTAGIQSPVWSIWLVSLSATFKKIVGKLLQRMQKKKKLQDNSNREIEKLTQTWSFDPGTI